MFGRAEAENWIERICSSLERIANVLEARQGGGVDQPNNRRANSGVCAECHMMGPIACNPSCSLQTSAERHRSHWKTL